MEIPTFKGLLEKFGTYNAVLDAALNDKLSNEEAVCISTERLLTRQLQHLEKAIYGLREKIT